MNKEKEIETVTLMVRRYCWGVHGTRARRLADTPYRSSFSCGATQASRV